MIRPFDSVMLRVLLRPLTAMLLVFAVYVVSHGHYSPGGGFQGGVLLACAFFLPVLVEGRRSSTPRLMPKIASALAAGGLLIFAAAGIAPLVSGSDFMDYAALPLGSDPAHRRFLGILIIEVGVALAVAGVILTILHRLDREVKGEGKTRP